MNRIIIIGCPGSGKSTFAKHLHDITKIPLFHLDLIYWNPDKTTVPKEVFRRKLQKIMKQDQWILDGNYGSTMELRMQACDTVFFLDIPAEQCLEGVRERKGKPRSDMPWVETEDDAEFLSFIENYRTVSRPRVMELLGHCAGREIHIFKNREEAKAYLCILSEKGH